MSRITHSVEFRFNMMEEEPSWGGYITTATSNLSEYWI